MWERGVNMAGFDTTWEKHPEAEEKQNIVMIVHFRPDKLPKDVVEWYELLGNSAHTTAKLLKQGVLPNKETKDLF